MRKAERQPKRVSPQERGASHHYLFGYYDKCPWDRAGHRILAHRTSFLDRFPNPDDKAEIGYIRVDGIQEFIKLGETTAWNWQQGAQLQWLPADHSDTDRVIFNDRRDGRLVTTIVDPDSGAERVLDSPIYTIHPAGRVALSLNYARLFDMRMDYGVSGLTDPYKDDARPERDGIYRVDLQTGTRKLIVSIAEVAGMSPHPLGEGAKHWVNHMMFNPSGKRFCFLHRFQRPDGILHTRLFTAYAEGGNLRLLFDGMVSHYSWKDEKTILAWAGRRRILGGGEGKLGTVKSYARRCLKPIYYALGKPRILMQKVIGDSYYLISDGDHHEPERFAYGLLTSDGHCTLSADGKWVLTDGYTDAKNRLPLLLCRVSTPDVIEIGRFPTPRRLDGPVRVDLHPRFNHDGTKVCIDSAMDGTRQIYILDVSDVVKA